MKPKRHNAENDGASEQAIYEQHVDFFKLALAHFELPHDAATIAHRAALQDHVYMDQRRHEAEQAEKKRQQVLDWMEKNGYSCGMFALPIDWHQEHINDAAEASSLAELEADSQTGMFAIPHHMMVPNDGSYPPELGATRMLDMMVEAGLVVREEPKVSQGTDSEVHVARQPAARYWGTEQAAISARRHEEARHRAHPGH